MLQMATLMSGIGFQELMAAIGSQSTGTETTVRKISRSETIHSGHFMVSEIEENEQSVEQQPNEPSNESDYERPDETTNQIIAYNLAADSTESTQTYAYGPKFSNTVSIDGSLTKLFECMSLAYNGKITSPRWKTFKGLKLKLKDKIRLNNIIWRAWHIQYIACRNPIVCQFSSPIDGDSHKKPEAVILEGKYWKRRLTTVTAEYQKWRMYYRKIGRPQTPTRPSYFDWENRWINWGSNANSMSEYAYDDYSMDFSDSSLFSTLLQPNLIDFPNPREIARSGMGAEFMQPGLVQLQPNLDDFMDTFEPLQEFFFNSKNMSSLPTLPEETAVENTNINNDQQNSKICQSIPQVSDQSQVDILNSLLCQTTTTTTSSTPLQNFSVDIENDLKQNSNESLTQNQSQMSSEIDLQFKSESMQAIQPQSVPQLQSIQSMPVMSDKPMRGQGYTQFRSSSMGPQREVPLQRSQSPVYSTIHNKNRVSVPYDFAQQENTTFSPFNMCDVSQTTNEKNSPYKQKYVNLSSPEANLEKFVVPKAVPMKQRSRARSISTPHINNTTQSFTLMPTQAAISLTDIHSIRSNQSVERSSSLPVYTQQRRKGVTTMSKNTTNTSSSNVLYPSQQQHQQQLEPNAKMANNGQTNEQISVPSHSYPSHQLVLSNAYNAISQGSSAGSTLIARLLTSNSFNNISNITPQIYSNNNQSAAQLVNMSNNTSNNRSTTIDASCIGIRTPVTTTAVNEKPHFLFTTEFKEANISSLSGQMHHNIKPNFVFQSVPDLRSPTSQVPQMSSPIKSRSPPVAMNSPKDGFTAMPSIPSPPSLTLQLKSTKSKSAKDRVQYKEHRRVCHINAEQKRRCNIKNGFDTLKSLLPSLSQNTNTKISKAAMLQKAAEYIRTLKNDRSQQQDEYDLLKHQVESLNQTIGVFQNQLPATGAPISCQRSSQTRELYENYVKTRTLQNWKFWIFSIIMESLLESYNSTVATSNVDEMCKTLLRWLDQNCCLITLRRDVMNSLRFLSTSTNILTNPLSLPEEAVLAVTKKEKQSSS